MPDSTRAGIVLGLCLASLASYALGLTYLCWAGLIVVGIVLGVSGRVLARHIDPEYSDAPRLARLARAAAQLALAVTLLSPVWMFAVSEAMHARRSQRFGQVLGEARAVAEAQQGVRKVTGAYVTLECLADGSRCPAGIKPPALAFLLQPERGGYRFTFRGVPQPGAGGRLDAFAYMAVPMTDGSACQTTTMGESLVCADSTGVLCAMRATDAAGPLSSGRCPAGCRDIRR